MRLTRPVLTVLTGLTLAAGGLVTTALPATAADPATSIKINEVQSNGADYVELTNVGTTATDVSGLVLMDNMPRTLRIPAGTSIAPGGFLAVDVGTPADGFASATPTRPASSWPTAPR